MNNRRSNESNSNNSGKTGSKRSSKRLLIKSGIEYKSGDETKKRWSELGTAWLNTADDGTVTVKLDFQLGMPHPGAELVCFEPRENDSAD